jgi:riboflavin kinase/FMN adenylyltransferase
MAAAMSNMVLIDKVIHNPNSVVTVGTFDGVHTGHRELLRLMVEKAHALNARSVVVTFDPHPREILQPGIQGIGLLTTPEERAEILADLGIDTMVVIPFNRDFSLMDSTTFIRDIIYGRIGLKAFIIGYDHHFGHNRSGDSSTITELGNELGFSVDIVQAQELNHLVVSSSVARRSLIQDGNTDLVKSLLDRSYRLSGIVVHGDARGRTIGFPTANMRLLDPRKIVPKPGVYAVRVELTGGFYRGMMNIGMRPTFGDSFETRLEVHLIDFTGDLYGQKITVHFEGRMRDDIKFSSVNGLIEQLQNDREFAIKLLK